MKFNTLTLLPVFGFSPPDPSGNKTLRVTKKLLQIIRLALKTKSVAVYLRHVPNQPITYRVSILFCIRKKPRKKLNDGRADSK